MNRYLRALARDRRTIQSGRLRKPLRLNGSQQAAVIEALREEYDLLHRGEPDGWAVEAALRRAEAQS